MIFLPLSLGDYRRIRQFLRAQENSYSTKAEERHASSCFLFLFFKIPLSKPRLESQATCTAFVFQGLSAPLRLQCQHRLAEAVGQTKLHHRERYQLQNIKTLTRSFQDKEDRSAGVRTKGEVKGGETEKTEKEKERD